jgi:hypothetical protein
LKNISFYKKKTTKITHLCFQINYNKEVTGKKQSWYCTEKDSNDNFTISRRRRRRRRRLGF